MRWMILFWFLSSFSPTCFGDEFLGFDPEAKGSAEVESQSRKNTPQPITPVETADSSTSNQRNIGVAGGVNAGFGFFEGNLSLSYFLNKFVSIDTNAFYYKRDGSAEFEESYGPEVDLVFRLQNPTLVTPFAGAGPGYSYWKRMYNDENFDEAGALTANVFAGLNLALTKFFGIQLLRKQQRYLMDPPKSFEDKKTPERSERLYTSIGFRVFL